MASAVSVASAGASFSLNAQANLDISNGVGPTLQSKKGWEPQVTYSYPVFTTSGGVSLIPYVRWGVEFVIDVYNQVRLKPAISSQTLVTMQSSYSDEPQGQCSANKLVVSTYMSTKSMMKLRNGVYDTWYSGSSRALNQCFEAPDMIPTAEDIAELLSLPATSSNARTIITIERAATFDHSGLKRRDATATQQLAARAVYTPGLVQDWDSKKISFACKQIATGTETVTQQVTTTIGVGTATVTATTTVARPGGDLDLWAIPGQLEHVPRHLKNRYLKYNSNDPDSLISGNGGYPSLVLDTWYLSETGRLITQNPYARGGFVATVRNSNKIIFDTPGSNPNPDGAEALYCQKDPNNVCSGVLSCSTDTRNGLSFTPLRYNWWLPWGDVRFYDDFRPQLGDRTPGSEMATFTWEAVSCAY
ncbi:hypothetical protein FOXG_09839 [Fusarium oxysporum f. sp. lycopersici 4287]|uniref:Uncharacterized protein n=2 Tax=Fusarium oxysporum TaxID=5507 RepID=A0A0J9WPK9_FUSO4|nr:hypothetical protein FOXG_09839 [Fusarium oxysporum f. sp. lycopersici 4287]KNB09212.1 hypothetical protein FOXG_09839 [Fusarium oxysporum f. sp. lycopersici 4287]